MVEVKALYKSLRVCLQSKKILLDNLVGFVSDTTNVMVEEPA